LVQAKITVSNASDVRRMWLECNKLDNRCDKRNSDAMNAKIDAINEIRMQQTQK